MPVFWRDYVRPSEHLETLQERQRDVYKRIDSQKFGWKIVLVAGAGFLTDAYDIFAVNMVLPMLKIVYWKNELPPHQETSINLATLVGTIIGQLAFGILADRYGRKKMYGLELVIVIVATVGLALCSKGVNGSVNILAWVVSWRLLMGIGIGADYPLSAVIVSEFSPRKHRARMLATVFYMQPIGQFLANLIAIIATTLSRRYISHHADPSNCIGDCLETTDKIWRWIVGLGAVLPALALLARLFIPESPRYLLEVEKDSHTAEQNANKYFTNPTNPFADSDDEDESSTHPEGATEPMNEADTERDNVILQEGIPMEQSQRRHGQVHGDERPMFIGNSHPDSQTTDLDTMDTNPLSPTHYLTPERPSTTEASPHGGYTISAPRTSSSKDDVVVVARSVVPSTNQDSQERDGLGQPLRPSVNDAGNDNHAPDAPGGSQSGLRIRKASWKEFWKGFYAFLFTQDSPNVQNSEQENSPAEPNRLPFEQSGSMESRQEQALEPNGSSIQQRPHTESREENVPPESNNGQVDSNNPSIPKRRWTDGNWTDLAGTCLAWFLLDFSFYFLGVNSWKVISKVWDTPEYTSVYQLVIQLSWRALVSVSVSSIIGGALFIAMARYRHNLQVYGFLILAVFLIAVGATFVTLLGGRYFAAIIVLYFFTQLFFDFGPNTSTFIIPAEVFPTQYRASCHGISAAFGKLGSIVAQIIAQLYLNDNRTKRLGYALILFSLIMILGAIVTKAWVPNPCNIYGESRSLEELANGKKARNKLERDEKKELKEAEQARYANV